MTEPTSDDLNRLFQEGFTKQTMRQSGDAAALMADQHPQFVKNFSDIMDRVIEQAITDETFAVDSTLCDALAKELNALPDVNCSPDDPLVTNLADFIASSIEYGRQHFITQERFSLDQYIPDLTAIIGSDDPEFIEALEDITSIFVHFAQNSADMPGLTEVKKTLGSVNLKAKALQDYLAMIESQPQVHELLTTTLALRDHAKLLDSLHEQLGTLLSATALVEDTYSNSRIKWPQQCLAMRIGQLLRDRGIKLTKYRGGAFCECLKVILRATEHAEPDNSEGKESDTLHIIRAIWPSLEDE